jgi:peptidoglycan hydrolase-like protein with peptidoglycan-binding domain
MNLQGRNLSLETSGSDVQLLLNELTPFGLKIPEDELQKSTFGMGTHEAVMEFQKQNGPRATDVVDAATAKEINKRVDALNSPTIGAGSGFEVCM